MYSLLRMELMVSYFVVHLCEMLDEHDIDGCPKFRCSVTKFENPVVALAGKGAQVMPTHQCLLQCERPWPRQHLCTHSKDLAGALRDQFVLRGLLPNGIELKDVSNYIEENRDAVPMLPLGLALALRLTLTLTLTLAPTQTKNQGVVHI